MVELKNVTKIYFSKDGSPEVKAVDDASMTLGNEGLVFVLGRSGGGKSTILNLLGGIDEVSSGEIVVDGVPVSSLGRSGLDSYRNTYVGFVFQEYYLLDDRTVMENVSLALGLQGKAHKGRVEECLEKVGIDHLKNRKCSALSGGQKQRVAIARALVKEPKLLLADEPTGALDSVTGKEIMGLLKELSKERLVVVVSHDRGLAETFGDRVIKIEDGKVTSDTSSKEHYSVKNSLVLNKSKMRIGTSFLMAFRSLGAKASRLVATMLLSVSAFTVFAVGNAISNIDVSSAITSAVDASKNKEICIKDKYKGALVLKNQEEEIRKKTQNKIFFKEVFDASLLNAREIKVIDKGAKNELIKQSPYSKVYDITEIDSFTSFNENDLIASGFEIEGSLPKNDGEIAISKVIYDGLSRRVGLTTYEGLVLNFGRPLDDYEVVGVIDNHFDSSKYEGLKKKDIEKNENLKNDLESDLKNGFATTVYLSESFYEKHCGKVYSSLELSFKNETGVGLINEEFEFPVIANSIEGLYEEFLNLSEDNGSNNLTRRGFLEKYFIVPKGHEVTDLLKNDEEFVSLDDDEVVCAYYKDEYTGIVSEYVEELREGHVDLTSRYNAEELGIKKIKAAFFNSGHYGNRLFSHNIVVSPKNYDYLKRNSDGAHAIKAVLSHDHSLNEEFIDYFVNIYQFMVQHRSSKAINEYSTFLSYPLDVIYYVLIFSLAFLSSLILMSFISISMSYGKKETGILRALGAKNTDVLFIYVLEAFLIALISSVLSTVVSLAMCAALNFAIGVSLGFQIRIVSLTFFEPLVVFGLTTLASLIAVAFPVWKNRNIKPIDEIRGH